MSARRQNQQSSAAGRGNQPEDPTAATAGGQVRVPLLDLTAQYAEIESEIREAIEPVFRTQKFILGENVKQLEERIAAYSQCDYGIGVSSGTDALLVALMALDIGPGDEVITTPYSFFATAGVIDRVGARAVFCDIDPATYNLSPEAVADFVETRCTVEGGRLLNRETRGQVKALMPVHLFGQTADMDPLLELARRYHLSVVEDAAQAIGSEYAGSRRAGSMGDIGCFSFFPSKNLGAFGDAGMCTTNDPELAERLRILRVHGAASKYHHAVVGGNFRIDELQAAILGVKLNYLDSWTEGRQRNGTFYQRSLNTSALGSNVSTPQTMKGHRHIFNQYVLRVGRRDELRTWLSEAGIGTAIYYPLALHRQECFSKLGYGAEEFPESNRAAAETLAIPIYPELTEAQLQHVVERIVAFYNTSESGRNDG